MKTLLFLRSFTSRDSVWKGVERQHTADFVFSIDEDQLSQLPMRLVRQAGNIAQRVLKEIIYANEK